MATKKKGQESLAQQMIELRRQMRVLQEKMRGDSADKAKKLQHNIPAWAMIREYLQSVGGQALDTEIADALVAAGHNLGKYPLRTVANSIRSPRLAGMFLIERTPAGNYVTLSKSFQYRTHSQRYPAASSKPVLVKGKPKTSK